MGGDPNKGGDGAPSSAPLAAPPPAAASRRRPSALTLNVDRARQTEAASGGSASASPSPSPASPPTPAADGKRAAPRKPTYDRRLSVGSSVSAVLHPPPSPRHNARGWKGAPEAVPAPSSTTGSGAGSGGGGAAAAGRRAPLGGGARWKSVVEAAKQEKERAAASAASASERAESSVLAAPPSPRGSVIGDGGETRRAVPKGWQPPKEPKVHVKAPPPPPPPPRDPTPPPTPPPKGRSRSPGRSEYSHFNDASWAADEAARLTAAAAASRARHLDLVYRSRVAEGGSESESESESESDGEGCSEVGSGGRPRGGRDTDRDSEAGVSIGSSAAASPRWGASGRPATPILARMARREAEAERRAREAEHAAAGGDGGQSSPSIPLYPHFIAGRPGRVSLRRNTSAGSPTAREVQELAESAGVEHTRGGFPASMGDLLREWEVDPAAAAAAGKERRDRRRRRRRSEKRQDDKAARPRPVIDPSVSALHVLHPHLVPQSMSELLEAWSVPNPTRRGKWPEKVAGEPSAATAAPGAPDPAFGLIREAREADRAFREAADRAGRAAEESRTVARKQWRKRLRKELHELLHDYPGGAARAPAAGVGSAFGKTQAAALSAWMAGKVSASGLAEILRAAGSDAAVQAEAAVEAHRKEAEAAPGPRRSRKRRGQSVASILRESRRSLAEWEAGIGRMGVPRRAAEAVSEAGTEHYSLEGSVAVSPRDGLRVRVEPRRRQAKRSAAASSPRVASACGLEGTDEERRVLRYLLQLNDGGKKLKRYIRLKQWAQRSDAGGSDDDEEEDEAESARTSVSGDLPRSGISSWALPLAHAAADIPRPPPLVVPVPVPVQSGPSPRHRIRELRNLLGALAASPARSQGSQTHADVRGSGVADAESVSEAPGTERLSNDSFESVACRAAELLPQLAAALSAAQNN